MWVIYLFVFMFLLILTGIIGFIHSIIKLRCNKTKYITRMAIFFIIFILGVSIMSKVNWRMILNGMIN